jgi:hypothetical protein
MEPAPSGCLQPLGVCNPFLWVSATPFCNPLWSRHRLDVCNPSPLWRSYFFDSQVVPLVIVVMSVAAISGCDSTITYGELRRRELFHALLMAWVLGLALMWRWWRRPRPPQSGTAS